MGTNRKQSELDSLETYRLVLTNVNNQPDIARNMAEIGYNAEVLAEGRKLYEKSLVAYAMSKKERGERLAAHRAYMKKWNALQEKFDIHRKKAGVVFRKDEQATSNLLLESAIPTRYLGLIAMMKDFYSKISASDAFKQAIARLSVPEEEINECQNMITEVEELRAIYMKEKGESQDATEQKRVAFRETEEWMKDFFAVAKIAIRKNPQLQEAFGKIVKN